MKKIGKSFIAYIIMGVSLASCHRTSREAWEDTKTAGRYLNKGMHSLFGRHVDRTGPIVMHYDNANESEFMPLTDDDRYISDMQDYPVSKESPGDPGSTIPGIEGFSSPMGKLAAIFTNVHFDTDNYVVKGHENLESLNEIADYLMKHPRTYIFVAGHSDERGAASYNLSLSSKRANSVRNFLIDRGVSPDQLFSISYGKEHPMALGHDETAWSQNRRAEFKIYER